MKTRSFNKAVLISLLSLFILFPISARTVLVHSPDLGEEPQEDLKLMTQSAEAGIMDVLFNRGCIVFSDSTELDLEELGQISRKSDADFAIDWKVADTKLKGRLIDTENMTILEESQISVSEYESLYKNHEELYTILGTRLCEMLVGERW